MNRRGQTLVLFALTLLLLTLMVAMTLSFADRAKQRAELQTVADAAAYTTAIETARTYNSVALLNRTSVSEWVAMAGVQALTAWGTMTGAYMGEWGEMVYDFQTPVPGKFCKMQEGLGPGDPDFDQQCKDGWDQCGSGCPADCSARTSTTRAAAYEFWHARLSLYSPDPNPADNVNQMCWGDGKSPGCLKPRDVRTPGEGTLDADVAKQENDIRSAVHNLAAMQLAIYKHLDNQVHSKSNVRKLVTRALGSNVSQDVDIYEAASDAQWDYISHTSTTEDRGQNDVNLLQAVLGSIKSEFPSDLGGAPPPQVTAFMNEIKSNLATTHPSSNWDFGMSNTFKGCTQFTRDSTRSVADSVRCKEGYLDGWNAATAQSKQRIWASYTDPCTGARKRLSWDVQVMIRSTTDASDHSAHTGSIDWGPSNAFYGGCHGTHGYWDIISSSDHDVGPKGYDHDSDLLLGGIAYIFPGSYGRGLNGQPKLPVMLGRHFDSGQLTDPWDLTARFRLISAGAKVDLQSPTVHGDRNITGALANGVAYYHRRGHWVEPANLLNPYWHATLVPTDIDHGAGEQPGDQTRTALTNSGFNTSANVYRAFENMGYEGAP